jgi:MFS family permease
MDIPLFLLFAVSAYLAGRMAERRGRSFKNWVLIAACLIGPLALPLLWLLPNLHGKNGGDADGPRTAKVPG